MQDILDLGIAFGPPDNRRMTTFADTDSIGSDALHSAYERATTLVGLAAGMLKLLRDPYLVQALLLHGGKSSLTAHLISIWEVQLASVFGDRATIDAARALMRRAHEHTIRADDMADWFVAAVGNRRSYALGSSGQMKRLFAATCGPVAFAHDLDVLGWHGDEDIYMDELATSFGWVCGINSTELPTTVGQLRTRDPAYVQQLLGREQLAALGLDDLTQFLDMVILPDGQTVRAVLGPIVSLLDADDIAAHGLEGVVPRHKWFALDSTSRLPRLTVSYRGGG